MLPAAARRGIFLWRQHFVQAAQMTQASPQVMSFCWVILVLINRDTSSTAQGGGESLKIGNL